MPSPGEPFVAAINQTLAYLDNHTVVEMLEDRPVMVSVLGFVWLRDELTRQVGGGSNGWRAHIREKGPLAGVAAGGGAGVGAAVMKVLELLGGG